MLTGLTTCSPSILLIPPPPNSCRFVRPLASTAIRAAVDQELFPNKLVTFLGKGGSGKTTASVLAAQHYAETGLKTCLLVSSHDSTADRLLNCEIGTSPTTCKDNLTAVRLNTTKMILEPLKKIKEADQRLNLSGGVLEGVVGEELGVLPGMDSVFSILALERYAKFLGIGPRRNPSELFDVVVYDGISSEDTLRMMGASGKARLYLRYARNIAKKTDLGRLAVPSVLALIDDALGLTGSQSALDITTSDKIWETMETILERGSSAFSNPSRFGCFIVMDPCNPASVDSALRYWGCTLQAGAVVSGAFAISSLQPGVDFSESIKDLFAPLPISSLTLPSFANPQLSVKFDPVEKSVSLLMPGFRKSDIKLYQFRGGAELLVEAGDQRRVIRLPPEIQGKVGGAKFVNRSLVITIK
ncbi:hypothetical protein MLD38_024378 [Melastoma candidum]|uniref:Uncharacterized protein n=1 Tax=Melastoma candidum TaxID=119954 RepID=A0ACB9NTS9_9MYRT|nr:hypothetical protein MLD38_024378 [Melastoma candidum]